MRSRDSLRKGELVAAVLSGSWRSSDFPPLQISERALDEVTPLLCTSGGAGLSWRRIRGTDLAGSPAAEVLHQAYRLQSLQTTLHEEKVEKIFRLLRQASVDAILAKGWAAARLYEQTDLRPSGDIDLCVRPSHLKTTKDVLRTPEAIDCWIDLHKHFSELNESSFDELFARSQVDSLGAEQIRILGPEDHLALLCIHLLKHGAWRPLWLCDISAAIESLPPTFDWSLFLGQRKHRAGWIASAIGLGRKMLGVKTDQLPLEAGRLEIPNWLVQTTLYHWSNLFPGDRLPMRPAPLMAGTLRERRDIIQGILDRWPDPITATFNLDGKFNNFPRFPYQLLDFLRISARFMLELPTKLESER